MPDYIVSTKLLLEGVSIAPGVRGKLRDDFKKVGRTKISLDNVTISRGTLADIKRSIESKLNTSKIRLNVGSIQLTGAGANLTNDFKKRLAAKPIALKNFQVTQSAINSIARQIASGLNRTGISLKSFIIGQPTLSPQRANTRTRTISRASRGSIDGGNIDLATDSLRNFGRQAGITLRRFAAYTVVRRSFDVVERAISDAARSFLEFDKQANRLAQTLKTTPKDVKIVTDEVRKLSINLGVSSNELAAASVQFAQAGIPLKEIKTLLGGLAQTDLSPSFESIEQTTEGIIALRNQFRLSSDEVVKSLSSINSVAAAFAVESGDIVEAIRRSGGSFKAANGNLNELLATFTAVRQATRLSAPTIANSFNTILSRLQSPKVQAKLANIGISLVDEAKQTGELVSPLQQFIRLAEGINKLPSNKQFQILFDVAGQRQLNKIIPLLQNISVAQQAYALAVANSSSLVLDAATAQSRYETSLKKVQETFKKTFADFASNDRVRDFFTGITYAAGELFKVLDKLAPLAVALPGLLAVRKGSSVRNFLGGLTEGLSGNFSGGLFGGPIRDLRNANLGQPVSARGLAQLASSPALFQNKSNAGRANLLSSIGVTGFGGLASAKLSQQISSTVLSSDAARTSGVPLLFKKLQRFNALQGSQTRQINDIGRLVALRGAAKTQLAATLIDAEINRLKVALQRTITNTNKVALSMAKLSGTVENNISAFGKLRAAGGKVKGFARGVFNTGLVGSVVSASLLDSSVIDENGDVRADKNKRLLFGGIQGGIFGASLGGAIGSAIPGIGTGIGVVVGGAAGAFQSISQSLKEISELELDRQFQSLKESISSILDEANNAPDVQTRRGIFSRRIGELTSDPNKLAETLFGEFEKEVQAKANAETGFLNRFIGGNQFGSSLLSPVLNKAISSPQQIKDEIQTSIESANQLTKIRDLVLQSGNLSDGNNLNVIKNRLNPSLARAISQQQFNQGSIKAGQIPLETVKQLKILNEAIDIAAKKIADLTGEYENSILAIRDISNTLESGISVKDFITNFETELETLFNSSATILGQSTKLKISDNIIPSSLLSDLGPTTRNLDIIGGLTGRTDITDQAVNLNEFRQRLFLGIQDSVEQLLNPNAEEGQRIFNEVLENAAEGLTLPSGLESFAQQIITGYFGDIQSSLSQGNVTGVVDNFTKAFVDSLDIAGKELAKGVQASVDIFQTLLEAELKSAQEIKKLQQDAFKAQQNSLEFSSTVFGKRAPVSVSEILSAQRTSRATLTGTNGSVEGIARSVATQLTLRRKLQATIIDPTVPFGGSNSVSAQTQRRLDATLSLQRNADAIERFKAGLESIKDTFSDVTAAIKEELDALNAERDKARDFGQQLLTSDEFRQQTADSFNFLDSFTITKGRKNRPVGFNLEALRNAFFNQLSDEERGATLRTLDFVGKEKFRGTDVTAEDFANQLRESAAGFNSEEFKTKEAALQNKLADATAELTNAIKQLILIEQSNLDEIRSTRDRFGVINTQNGINIEGRKSGGLIQQGKRTFSGVDSQLIAAQPGEFVVKKSVAQKNLGFLSALNGGVQGYAEGGLVRNRFAKNPQLASLERSNAGLGILEGIFNFGSKALTGLKTVITNPSTLIKPITTLGSGLGKFVAGNNRNIDYEDRQRLLDEAGQEIFSTILAPLGGAIQSTGDAISPLVGGINPTTGRRVSVAKATEGLLDVGTLLAGAAPTKIGVGAAALKAGKPLAKPLALIGGKTSDILTAPFSAKSNVLIRELKNIQYNGLTQAAKQVKKSRKPFVSKIPKRNREIDFGSFLRKLTPEDIFKSLNSQNFPGPSGRSTTTANQIDTFFEDVLGLPRNRSLVPTQRPFPTGPFSNLAQNPNLTRRVIQLGGPESKKLPYFPDELDFEVGSAKYVALRKLRQRITFAKDYEQLQKRFGSNPRFQSYADQLNATNAYGLFFPSDRVAALSFKKDVFAPSVGNRLKGSLTTEQLKRIYKRHEVVHGLNQLQGTNKLFGLSAPDTQILDELISQLESYKPLVKKKLLTRKQMVNRIKGSFTAQNYPFLEGREDFLKKILADISNGVIHFRTGGLVPGKGGGDRVPARLTPGEFVVNQKSTAKNRSLLEAVNSGVNFAPKENSRNINFDTTSFMEAINKLDSVAGKLASIPSLIEVQISPVSVNVTGLNLQNMITVEAVNRIAQEVFKKLTGEEIRKKLSRV